MARALADCTIFNIGLEAAPFTNEDIYMRRFLTATVFFSMIATAPIVVRADDDHPRAHEERHERKAYYDRVHKDRHEWDEHEAAAWDRYRDEHHIEAREFE